MQPLPNWTTFEPVRPSPGSSTTCEKLWERAKGMKVRIDGEKGEVGSRFAAAQTVNVRSRAEEKKMFVAIRNDWRGYSEGRTYSGRNKYRSGLGRSLSIRYGNWMFRIEDRENRRCSQTILHRVLTVGKSIRDSRFDLYDQIPGGCIARGIERTSWNEQ